MMRILRITTSWRRRATATLTARASRAQRDRARWPPALRIALRALRRTVETLDLWWTRLPTRAAGPVPDDADTYEFCTQCNAEWEWRTNTGILLSPVGRLREEHHSWVTDIRWARKTTRPGPSYFNPLELRLGESEHIDGLGTLTLVEVWPEPLIERLYRDFAGHPPRLAGRRMRPLPGIPDLPGARPRHHGLRLLRPDIR